MISAKLDSHTQCASLRRKLMKPGNNLHIEKYVDRTKQLQFEMEKSRILYKMHLIMMSLIDFIYGLNI